MEQFQQYLQQLLGKIVEIVVWGVWAQNLMRIIFGVICLLVLIPISVKLRQILPQADWDSGNFAAVVSVCLIVVFVICTIAGLLLVFTNGWKLLAPEFAAIEYLLR